jgi:hypothetical protein
MALVVFWDILSGVNSWSFWGVCLSVCQGHNHQERAVKGYNYEYSKINSSFVARARGSSASFEGLGWRVAGAPLSRAEFRTS